MAGIAKPVDPSKGWSIAAKYVASVPSGCCCCCCGVVVAFVFVAMVVVFVLAAVVVGWWGRGALLALRYV